MRGGLEESEDAYGRLILDHLEHGGQVEIVERDNGFVAASRLGPEAYFAPSGSGRSTSAPRYGSLVVACSTSAAAPVASPSTSRTAATRSLGSTSRRSSSQRPRGERLVRWLLTNGIEVSQLSKSIALDGQTFAAGSYVVWMDQAHRGLAETALGIGDDVSAWISTLYTPPCVFPADAATAAALDAAGREAGVYFRGVSAASLPALDPIDRVPRIAVLTGALNQDIWVLRNVGFTADPIATGSTSPLNDPGAPNPLAKYDVAFNTAGWPSGVTARARLTVFFADHGGYLGAGANGAAFLTSAAHVTGLTAASRTGAGRSGIVYWNNLGGFDSPIVRAYPLRDTAIMDPPTWFTSTGPLAVDARFPNAGFFAAGLWLLDAQSATAPGSAVIAHGTNTAGTARVTVYAMNPLYRADPEREWPSISTAAYWSDQ